MTGEQKPGEQAIYHIRVHGTIDENLGGGFEGFVIASRDSGETLLSGPVADQAALHDLLGKIQDLGLPLLLAVQMDCPCPKKNCPRHGHCQECAAYHAAKDGLSYCFRRKTRWDKRCAALIKARAG